MLRFRILATAATLAAAAAAVPLAAHAQTTIVSRVNLDSNLAGKAITQDKNLQNAWGIANVPGGAFWISDNNSGLSTLYSGTGAVIPLVVTLTPPAGQTVANPTGIVWNPSSSAFSFMESGTAVSALFIFDGEEGTISAWAPLPGKSPPTATTIVVDNSKGGAVYKGLAYGTNATGNFIFATNFHAGTVEAYDSSFALTALKGTFSDPQIPKDFAPFGIQNIDGDLFVTYARQDAQKHDEVRGPGLGYVNVFSTDGVLLKRFASRGELNAPWAVVRAPYSFGSLAGQILIGNFGNGWINAFPAAGGTETGWLVNGKGEPVAIPGLWALTQGTGADADPGVLYFTAGPSDETNGLFGTLTPHIVKSTGY